MKFPATCVNYSHTFEHADYDADLIAATAGLVMPVTERLRVNVGVQEGLWGKNADQATSFFLAIKLAF